MTLEPKAQALLASWQEAAAPLLKAVEEGKTADWGKARSDYVSHLEAMLPAPSDVRFEHVDMDGVPALLVTPDQVQIGHVLFYIHGGGYVHGSPRAYRGLLGHYAKKLGALVYAPDYRQAPEHPFPTPIDDTFRAYRALYAMGFDSSKIAISGDSAGGAMVFTIMRKARDAGLPLPYAGVAISPWADLGQKGPSTKNRDGLDPLCSTSFLHQLACLFLVDEGKMTHPDASPVHADLHELAPVLIQIGENEVMLSGAISLAERLAEQRNRTTLDVWPGMFHVWHSFAGQMRQADEALDDAVYFLKRECNRARQA